MTWVIFLNLWGFVFTKDSFSGVNIGVCRIVLNSFTYDVKTELAVKRLTFNQFARSCKVNPR